MPFIRLEFEVTSNALNTDLAPSQSCWNDVQWWTRSSNEHCGLWNVGRVIWLQAVPQMELTMGVLTDDMKRTVERQRLGFVATVCPDCTPNLSPKGTTRVWDDDHLIFADIRSPGTVANLRRNPAVEINVVDPITRKGYRFKGTAEVLTEGRHFEEAVDFFRRRGVRNQIKSVVREKVFRALPLISPAYDLGVTEEEVSARWKEYWDSVARGEGGGSTGE